MAKISDLSDGGSLLPTDDLVAVRSGANVKVKADNITVDRIDLGDNEKIRLGDSQDLEIYHSASDSIINDNGTGSLKLQQGGSTKLEVTTTGIDVTGTVTADGLTLSSEGDQISIPTSAGFSGIITTGDSISGNAFEFKNGNGIAIVSDTNDSAATGGVDATLIARGSSATKTALFDVNGDISFYEDTGTTAKLFWDASAESLGIGTASPDSRLVVQSPDNTLATDIFKVTSQNGAAGLKFGYQRIEQIGASTPITFNTGGSEAMRIEPSGKVGIGNAVASTIDSSSGLGNLVVGSGSGVEGITIYTGSSNYGALNFADATSGGGSYAGYIKFDHATDSFGHFIGNTERMRIDSSGNVGIGRSNPSSYVTDANSLYVKGQIRVDGVTNSAATPALTLDDTNSGLFAGASNEVSISTAAAERLRIGSTGHAYLITGGAALQWQNGKQTITGASDSNDLTYRTYEDHIWKTGTSVSSTTDGTERMRIDSSGNVGINNSSPVEMLTVGDTSDTNVRIQFLSSTTGANTIQFGDGTSAAAYRGYINYTHSDDALAFATAATERMRIDSSGNLLVGTTDNEPYNNNTGNADDNGIALSGGGWLASSRFNGVSAYFNRTNTPGDIVTINYNGATKGTIGSDGNILYIGSGEGTDAYLGFGNDIIRPVTSAGASRDNAIDLGYVGMKFKDVHAGGRGFFGLYSASIANGNIMVSKGVYVGAANGDNQIRSSSAGAGSATLYIGNAAIQVSSDQRLKTNIVDTEMNATEKLNQVRVVDFNWDDPSDTSFNNRNARGKWTGVLAQELVDVLPFAVNAPRNEEDLTIDAESDQKWLVDQAQMVPVLIKAIQELTARIAALEGAN